MQWRRSGRHFWLVDIVLVLISTGLVSACCRSCSRCISSEDDNCPPCDTGEKLELSAEQKEAISDPSFQEMIHSLHNNTQRLTQMQYQKQLIDVTEHSLTIADLFRSLFRSQTELSPISTETFIPVFSEPLDGVVQLCPSRVMYSAPLIGLDRNSEIIQVFQFMESENRQWILGDYCENEGSRDSGMSAVSCETLLCAHYAPIIGINLQRAAVGVWWIWTPCCLPRYVTKH